MAEKKVPMRMCVVCRTMKEKRELLRIVRTKDGTVEVDETGTKAGRGAYVCSDPKCRSKCIRTKFFQKLFQTEIPQEVYDRLSEDGHGADKV